jgi:hypothetical protein
MSMSIHQTTRNDDEESEAPARKKQKLEDPSSSAVVKALHNDSGEAYFDLSDKRRITVRTFKSKILVDIREASR